MAITLTQGDQIDLNLICKNHDLTGATLTTTFRRKDGRDLVIASGQHTVNADQTTNRGAFVLELTADDTAEMADGTNLDMITKVTQGSTVIHFHGTDILTVKKSSLRRG